MSGLLRLKGIIYKVLAEARGVIRKLELWLEELQEMK
jgi:hypothetical protein